MGPRWLPVCCIKRASHAGGCLARQAGAVRHSARRPGAAADARGLLPGAVPVAFAAADRGPGVAALAGLAVEVVAVVALLVADAATLRKLRLSLRLSFFVRLLIRSP